MLHMKSSLKFGALWLLVAGIACGPAGTAAPPTAPATPARTATAAPLRTDIPPATSAAPVPAATSRGPNLEASDPLSVSLASGQIQLVEFFRFT
jgi:hypothetical protein